MKPAGIVEIAESTRRCILIGSPCRKIRLRAESLRTCEAFRGGCCNLIGMEDCIVVVGGNIGWIVEVSMKKAENVDNKMVAKDEK